MSYGESKKLSVLVAPGQNSGRPGMYEIAERVSEVKEMYDHADEIALELFGSNMIDGDSVTGWSKHATKEILENNTVVTQPLIVATTSGLIKYLKSREEFSTAYGHSIGELAALYAAGSLSEYDVLRLSMLRGVHSYEASQKSPGKMAVLLNIPSEIREKMSFGEEHGVEMSTENSPGQFTISGVEHKIKAIVADVNDSVRTTYSNVKGMNKEEKRQLPRAMMLGIGGGFHSFLMGPAATAYRKDLDATTILPPNEMNYFSNHSHDYEGKPETIRDHHERQLTKPVLFWKDIGELVTHGHVRIVEAGPGSTITDILNAEKNNGTLPPGLELIAAEAEILKIAA